MLPPPVLTYETSNGLRTGRYEEALKISRILAAKDPKRVRFFRYGTTPEGRPMTAILLSHEGSFGPDVLAKSKRPLVVIQNGIHAGEIEGKDASLMILRDYLFRGKHRPTLDRVNLLVIPVYSVDGHERFGRYHRINQDGPGEMGWRATGQNLNLNRDWTKADAPETRAQIALLRRFRPDYFFDDHTTDGADFRYALTLGIPWGPTLPDRTALFQRRLYREVVAACDRAGILTGPYFSMRDTKDPGKGIDVQDFSPRYTNGYLTALGRPSMLVETHMLKPYAVRVEATRRVLLETIARIGGAWAAELKEMNRAADRVPEEATPVVLGTEPDGTGDPFLFKGWRYAGAISPITGRELPRWTHVPVDTPSRAYWNHRASFVRPLPSGYLVPLAWREVLDRLSVHGIAWEPSRDETPEMLRWMAPPRSRAVIPIRTTAWRLSDVKFPARPFENRFMPSFRAVAESDRDFSEPMALVTPKPGTWRLLMHLLEPEAPDSFLRWGFFNAVTETKEYFEDYSMEPIGREMLRSDAELRAEYDKLVENDPKFVGRARLQWLFDRSPYMDRRLNRYPVRRLDAVAE